ncbi:glycosyltransferase family 4 protein [Mesorhizobium sp. ZC-5]|uniref:glycosyltransferase family 4 protein n=1 Tax=Mesorhizobium sp. ZC-5 TaxID=2986066 RepID=UPI0021E82BF3|nr:glycosyltransferase family 4 protein [Mesorhizobium sp. ZC-5]MCV3243669.1 glycosyltransferase family 4 protein [Mesorhizobium sp. ZC-5]
MRILLMTDNYPPETNASALRCSAHARRWIERGENVTVITSFPNFPDGLLFKGYRQSLFKRATIDTVDVLRVPTLIFPNAGTVTRIIDFLSYMMSATISAMFVRRPDVVIATSPQFFAAVAGWLAAAVWRRPFVFELRDLWPDSVVAVGALKDGPVLNVIRRLEHFLYRRADLIVTVTNAFKDHLIKHGISPDKIAVVRNGADLSVFSPGNASALRRALGLEGKTIVSYIGTIGMAHGLDILLDVATALGERAPQVVLLIVGSGAEREELRRTVEDRGLKNLVFVDRVSHAEIVDYWRVSDMTLVLLKDDPLFRTVIPSKVFEAMATGTPIVTNVTGELDSLLAPLGAAVHVQPGNAPALADAIEQLSADNDRRRALSRAGVVASGSFHRANQADLMLEALKKLTDRRTRKH